MESPGHTGGLPKPTDPGYAEAKAKALAQNKKLPAQGTAKERSGDGRFAKTTPKQKGHINSELHEKAWQMIQTGAEE